MTLIDKIKQFFPTSKLPGDKKTFGDSILENNFAQLVEYVECVIAQIYKICSRENYFLVDLKKY